MEATDKMAEIPELRKKKFVIPAFRISPDISNYDARALDVYKEAPTLAQLRHADATSEAIRKNIRATMYKGEFSADFVDYNAKKPRSVLLPKGYVYAKLVQRPEHVEQKGDDLWTYEGGKVIGIELPPDGWQVPAGKLLYNPETGFPVRTVKDRSEAVKLLSRIMPEGQAEKEVSYSVRWDNNHVRLSPVSRYCGWADERGPFSVRAYWRSPAHSHPRVGSRVVQDMFAKI